MPVPWGVWSEARLSPRQTQPEEEEDQEVKDAARLWASGTLNCLGVGQGRTASASVCDTFSGQGGPSSPDLEAGPCADSVGLHGETS